VGAALRGTRLGMPPFWIRHEILTNQDRGYATGTLAL
jgi:hypothetical protein